ncbi:hypothetical protein QTN93_05070 [Sphingomonas aerolata]|uniref:hypothetical protein n=1 Tax=Sphingomonas aerolata TaxID=185951 RepID=UPI0035A58F63
MMIVMPPPAAPFRRAIVPYTVRALPRTLIAVGVVIVRVASDAQQLLSVPGIRF